MNGDGGTITVTLRMDNKQFLATAAAADATGKALGDNLDASTKAATDRVASRFATVGSAIKTGLGIGAVAIGVAGVASVKMAGDFEQAMNILGSVSGATGAQLAALSEKARELGKDASLPGVSAKDAALAMSELAKAGLSVNDVMAASKGVLSLAKAGQLDTANAATITARALNTFGLEGSQANKVADLLAAGANSSTAGVEDMAQALAQGGAGARQFGISIGDTVSALALFSNAGINGSDAGTSLKTMLQRLAAPTDESAAAMKKLGLNFFDAKGNFVGLSATAGQLQKALGGLTVEQKNAALATIFGSDSSRVAAVLANEGAAGFDKMAASVNKQGAATDLAAAQNSGFKGALDNLISTLETIGTDIGTKVLPPLTKFLQVLADKAEPTMNFIIKYGKELAITLGILATAIVAVKVAAFVSDLNKMVIGLKAAQSAAGGAAAAQKALAIVFGANNASGILALGKAFTVVGTAIKTFALGAVASIRAVGVAILTNPIGLIVTAIVAVIAALVILQLKFNIFGKLFEAMKPVFAAVGNFFIKVWQTAADIFTSVIDAIVGFWNSKLKPVFDVMITILGTILSVYIKVWAFILLIIVGTLSIIASVIWAVMQGIWNVITTVWNAIYGVIAAVVGFIWSAIVAYFTLYWNIITTVMSAIWSVITTVWNTIYGVVSSILSAIWGVVSSVFNTVAGFVGGIWNGIYNTVSGALSRIWSAVTGVFGNVVSFVGGIGGKILGAIGNFGGLLYDKGRSLIQGLIDGAGSLLSSIGKFFLDKVPGWIQEPFKKALGIHSPSRVFAGYGKNIVQGLGKGIDANGRIATTAATGLANQVSGIGANMNADITAGGTPIAPTGGAGGAGTTVNQYNTVNNNVDTQKLISDMTWALARS